MFVVTIDFFPIKNANGVPQDSILGLFLLFACNKSLSIFDVSVDSNNTQSCV